MSSTNLGWLFYKDYFTAIDDWTNPKNSEEALAKKVDELITYPITIDTKEPPLGNIYFKASTTYPGLILGSGYLHELPSLEGQAILGFDFDYTTGLPIIRGSSIKGVLRSAFKHPEYIQELLDGKSIDIKALEIEIFDNNDVFFDATIIKSVGSILADDYLAPHGDNPLKNPIPLKFIKVAPNVTFRFDFELTDGLISKEEKALLFGAILYDFGLGAKSNVGYGKFDDKLSKDRLKRQLKENAEEKEKEEKRLKEEEEKRQKAQKIASLSPIEALKEEIKEANDNKDIYDLLVKKDIKDDLELQKFVLDKIGEKPAKPKPAKRKWAIKIYEFFGL